MITSQAELIAMLRMAVTAAFEEVVEQAYRELQKHVLSDLYGAYYPTSYEGSATRNMGLIDSWKREVRGLAAELKFEPSMLPHDPENWVHGSQYDGGDTREAIIDILQAGYGAFNYHSPHKIPARPFWDNFIKVCDAKMDKWILQALRRQGLVVF